MSKTIKRTVKVTIEKEIEIELMPSMFGKMSTEEYLAEFNKSMYPIEGIDDIFEYAARMAATYGSGYQHDALGLVSDHYSTHPRVPDVKFREIYDDCETEILNSKEE